MSYPPRPISILALGVICATALLAAHEPGLATGIFALAPAAAAFLTLGAGRYPAERALVRLLRTRRRRPVRSVGLVGLARPTRVPPRGGRLIAASMAGRSPPAPSVA